jgi:hypothetical protein
MASKLRIVASVAAVIAVVGVTAVGESPSASAAGMKCRVARASFSGGWGSARICWTRVGTDKLGAPEYSATVHGAVRDTRADKHGMDLVVGYTEDSSLPAMAGVYQTIATAHHKGQVKRGVWARSPVGNVTIKVCRTGLFTDASDCSPDR